MAPLSLLVGMLTLEVTRHLYFLTVSYIHFVFAANSRRGDFEILGYNMLQWLCTRLPWEDKLTDQEYVASQKNKYMSDLPQLMKKCFPGSSPPGT